MTEDKAERENRVIAEMAEDLVSGRRTPQEVMADQAVAAEFHKGAARFGQWYESLSEQEKQAAEAAASSMGDRPQPEPGARLVRRRRPSTEAEDG